MGTYEPAARTGIRTRYGTARCHGARRESVHVTDARPRRRSARSAAMAQGGATSGRRDLEGVPRLRVQPRASSTSPSASCSARRSTPLVQAVVGDVLTPLIGLIGGNDDLANTTVDVGGAELAHRRPRQHGDLLPRHRGRAVRGRQGGDQGAAGAAGATPPNALAPVPVLPRAGRRGRHPLPALHECRSSTTTACSVPPGPKVAR